MKFSIIIPVYNKAPYLDSCISSVINQTYKNLEIIIIDDGSTDNSLEICEKYRERDERIELISQPNKGVSVARNLGIQKASGEWIYFLDADDYLELDAFEILMNEIKLNPDINIIQFGLNQIKNNQYITFEQPERCIYANGVDIIKNNDKQRYVAWLHLIKKSIIIDNNIRFFEDMRHNEDILFMYQVFLSTKNILRIDRSLYNHVISDNSVSRSEIKKIQIINNLQYVDRLIFFCKKENLEKSLSKELNERFKVYFISLSEYNQLKSNISFFQKYYRKIFRKHKDVLKSYYLKIAYLNLWLIILPLKIKNKYVNYKKNIHTTFKRYHIH